ncbi:MAG TPA: hypothetical protein VGI95_19255 [Caulobacteraceae bacterium]|jgi:hypothetical protein
MKPAFAAVSLAASVAAAAPAVAQPSSDALTSVAARTRFAIAASPNQALQALRGPSRRTFTWVIRSNGTEAFDRVWADLLTGAVQTRRETADDGVTLWFNPVFDAGLAVRWRRTDRGWVAVGAAPVLGETLRGEPLDPGAGAGNVAWPGATPSLAAGLTATAAADNQAAASGAWAKAFDAPARDRALRASVLISRVSTAELYLRLISRERGYRGYDAAIRQSLQGGPDQLGPDLKQDLAMMGEAGELGLRPVSAVRRPDGWSVVLQSSDAVGAAWFAHFTDPTSSGQAKLESFTVAPLTPALEASR